MVSANVVQQSAGIRLFYYCFHTVISKVGQANGIPKLRRVVDKLYYFFCFLISLTHLTETHLSPEELNLYFLCFDWNVNTIDTYNMLSVTLVEAYNTIHHTISSLLVKQIFIS